MNVSDIICAVSTAPGMGAIAVIRLSGQGCIALVDQLYESPSGKSLQEAAANTVRFGRIVEKGKVVDEVLVTVFHMPHSFSVEYLITAILSLCFLGLCLGGSVLKINRDQF